MARLTNYGLDNHLRLFVAAGGRTAGADIDGDIYKVKGEKMRKQNNYEAIRERILSHRAEIAKLPGGLIMLNMIIRRMYDRDDLLWVEHIIAQSEQVDLLNKVSAPYTAAELTELAEREGW